jgi:hypothetical protein
MILWLGLSPAALARCARQGQECAIHAPQQNGTPKVSLCLKKKNMKAFKNVKRDFSCFYFLFLVYPPACPLARPRRKTQRYVKEEIFFVQEIESVVGLGIQLIKSPLKSPLKSPIWRLASSPPNK